MKEVPQNKDLPIQNTEKPRNYLPIVDDKDIYYSDKTPAPVEGSIVHYLNKRGLDSDVNYDNYILQKKIANLNYVFYLVEGYAEGQFFLGFSTKEYEYATTNLDDNSKDVLADTIGSLINTVNSGENTKIREIKINPSDAAYSKDEIEECIREVLNSPDNTISEQDLRDQYGSFQIFDLYKKIYNKDFLKDLSHRGSRMMARSRYFKIMLKRALPDWQVKEDKRSSRGTFTLVPISSIIEPTLEQPTSFLDRFKKR